MSRWYVFFALALIFNVAMGVGYFLLSNNLYDYLMTEMSDISYTAQGGLYVRLQHVYFIGLQVHVNHIIYEDGQMVNFGSQPTVLPNYPYILFWVSMIGNFVLVALALVLHKSKSREAS